MAGIFGEPQVPKLIEGLKQRVKARDAQSAVKLERIWTDYSDRLDKAEMKLTGDLDSHAMDAESAIAELSNRGNESMAASGIDTEAPGKPADAVEPRRAPELPPLAPNSPAEPEPPKVTL